MDTSGGRSASGTSPWPYMPTRGPRRPACPSNGLVVGRRVRKAGRRVRKRGYVVSRGSAPRSRVIGDAPQLYTQQSGGCRARGSGNRATKRARSNYPPTEALTELRTIATSSRDSDPTAALPVIRKDWHAFPLHPSPIGVPTAPALWLLPADHSLPRIAIRWSGGRSLERSSNNTSPRSARHRATTRAHHGQEIHSTADQLTF
jgi:hypothetical protein